MNWQLLVHIVFGLGLLALLVAILFRRYTNKKMDKVILEHFEKHMIPLTEDMRELGLSEEEIEKRVKWAYNTADYSITYPKTLLRDHVQWLREQRDTKSV